MFKNFEIILSNPNLLFVTFEKNMNQGLYAMFCSCESDKGRKCSLNLVYFQTRDLGIYLQPYKPIEQGVYIRY